MNDFEVKISFDSDKFFKFVKEIKEKYFGKLMNTKTQNAMEQEVKEAAYNSVKIER